MKAILIDVKNQTVTDVMYDGNNSLNEWYRLMGCEMVETAMDIPNKDGDENIANTVLVDEEGLLNVDESTKFFTIKGGHQPFAGNGLIVGTNYYNGETVDVGITADDVRDKIKFMNVYQVQNFIP